MRYIPILQLTYRTALFRLKLGRSFNISVCRIITEATFTRRSARNKLTGEIVDHVCTSIR